MDRQEAQALFAEQLAAITPDQAMRFIENILPGLERLMAPRVLIDGADVTTTAEGDRVWGGPSRFPVINFTGATGVIHDGYERNQIDITAGGGVSTCYDYIVSPCWEDVVAAGAGTEGQVVPLFTGCSTKIYSLYQSAITDIATKADGTEWAILVCGLTEENIIVPAMTSGPDHIISHGVGGGSGDPGRSGIKGVSAVASSVFSIRQGAPRMSMKNMWMGSAFQNTSLIAHQSGCASEWENCTFYSDSSANAGFDCGSGRHISMRGCYFNGTGTANIGCAVLDSPDDVTINDCEIVGGWGIDFQSSSRCDDIVISGNRFVTGRIKVRSFRHLILNANKLQGHVSSPEIELLDGQDCTITGNDIDCSATNTGQPAILLATTGNLRDVAISGNNFGYRVNGQPFILSTNSDCQFVAIVGNIFGRTGTGYDITNVVGVQGTFANSIFGPNAPGVRTKYNITGTENEFYPPSSAVGPSVPASTYARETYISFGSGMGAAFSI